MTGYLLDTNAVIDVFADRSGTLAVAADSVHTYASVVTEVELRFGVARNPHDPRRIAQLGMFTSSWEALPVDSAVAIAYSAVAASALAAGQEPRRRMNDLLIGATALAHGLTLVTDDRSLVRAIAGIVPTTRLSELA